MITVKWCLACSIIESLIRKVHIELLVCEIRREVGEKERVERIVHLEDVRCRVRGPSWWWTSHTSLCCVVFDAGTALSTAALINILLLIRECRVEKKKISLPALRCYATIKSILEDDWQLQWGTKPFKCFLNLDCYLNNSGLADSNWLKILNKVN